MTRTGAQEPFASELRLNPQKSELSITFTDGTAGRLSAELLRVVSPSAEVQGHSPSERKLVPGKRDVTIRAIEPIGNYAVRLVFSDGRRFAVCFDSCGNNSCVHELSPPDNS